MVEESFWLSWSGMLQNEGFGRLISEHCHHGWRKFFIFVMWNVLDWIIWTGYLEYLHQGRRKFLIFLIWNVLEWKIWTSYFEYFHHGWRKSLIFVVWNAPEWRIWTAYLRIYSPWLKKKLFSWSGECLRLKNLDSLFQNRFTMVEEIFWFSWSGMLQNEGSGRLISEYFHHGWRKFLIFVVWNSPEWRIRTAYLRIHFTMVE